MKENWLPGEVIVTNHPVAGGSHLPDITIITPVFLSNVKKNNDIDNKLVLNKPIFYVASRGHHADVGGLTPGSMPPFSKSL